MYDVIGQIRKEKDICSRNKTINHKYIINNVYNITNHGTMGDVVGGVKKVIKKKSGKVVPFFDLACKWVKANPPQLSETRGKYHERYKNSNLDGCIKRDNEFQLATIRVYSE